MATTPNLAAPMGLATAQPIANRNTAVTAIANMPRQYGPQRAISDAAMRAEEIMRNRVQARQTANEQMARARVNRIAAMMQQARAQNRTRPAATLPPIRLS
jgi:hypothetical protein